jgi:hypothetical protein
MRKYIEYTEEQKATFLDYAKDMGIAKAIRELGYPTFPTARKWGEQYGVELPLNQLSQMANGIKVFYGSEEKLYVAQLLIDRIQEELMNDENKTGDELKKLSDALKRAIETIQLVEGKATQITQSINSDMFDQDYAELMRDMDRLNKEHEVKETN